MKTMRTTSSAGLAGPRRKSAAERAVDLTPTTRDRYVDFLRAFSITVVVLGHWLMAVVGYSGGRVTGDNAIEVVPGVWLLTWVFQVMPLFFFVGGFSNLKKWLSVERSGEGYGAFLETRIARLMRPTRVFIVVWLTAALGIAAVAPAMAPALARATSLIAKPLWFLAVYVLVTALTPVMVRLHRRFRAGVPVALLLAAVVCDVLRLTFGLVGIAYLNFAFVWLFAHQLGLFLGDGSWNRRRPAFFAGIGAVGLGALIALTSSGIYARSMVGAGGDGASNNSPPSICLIALSLWLIGAAMLLRPWMTKRLARPRTWRRVIVANSSIMTVFLWHLTAMLLAVLTILPAGFPQPSPGSTTWWLTRPLWLFVLTLCLVPFVAVFARFERANGSRSGARRPSAERALGGVVLMVAGLAALAQFGFDLSGSTTHTLVPVAGSTLALAGTQLVIHREKEEEDA